MPGECKVYLPGLYFVRNTWHEKVPQGRETKIKKTSLQKTYFLFVQTKDDVIKEETGYSLSIAIGTTLAGCHPLWNPQCASIVRILCTPNWLFFATTPAVPIFGGCK